MHFNVRNSSFSFAFFLGSAFRPEFIKINMSTNKNHIVAEVHWRFRVVCEEDPATNLEIVIEGPTSSQVHNKKLTSCSKSGDILNNLLSTSRYQDVFACHSLLTTSLLQGVNKPVAS